MRLQDPIAGGSRGGAPGDRGLGWTAVAVVVICTGLGIALGWGFQQSTAAARLTRERDQLAQRNWELENGYSVVLARRNDLAVFLLDARTKVFQLTGDAHPGGRGMAVAWQEETRTGFLIAEAMPLPPMGQRYAVWLAGSGVQEKAATFSPERGLTCVQFRVHGAPRPTEGFEIRVENELNVREPGTVLYRSRR